MNVRLASVLGLTVAVCVGSFFLPPITQDPNYHQFADQTAWLGIPNFWNVVSNLGFLGAALSGLKALRSEASFLQGWERLSYAILLFGVALVAFGSSYYHAWPNDATLFWDRLPMTIVFMALLATTMGERIGMRAGRLLLFPLLAIGIASILYWKWTGDLRPYVLVQFYPMLALPLLLLLFPPTYTGVSGIAAMIALYGVAKIFEFFDLQIGRLVSTGGHPWKHIAGAAAMICYVRMVETRRPVLQRT